MCQKGFILMDVVYIIYILVIGWGSPLFTFNFGLTNDTNVEDLQICIKSELMRFNWDFHKIKKSFGKFSLEAHKNWQMFTDTNSKSTKKKSQHKFMYIALSFYIFLNKLKNNFKKNYVI